MEATAVQPTSGWIARVSALLKSGQTGPQAVEYYLPGRDDPDYAEALAGLVKADLHGLRGESRISAWAVYRSRFPELPESESGSAIDDVITQLRSQSDLTQTPLPSSLAGTNATRVKPVDVVEVNPTQFKLPRVGDEFSGFRLVDELGRGAFGRVYLAREHKLAERLVALKLTRKPNGESQRLARLQHTNIVPVHNAFQEAGWFVLQMPYFGRQTLASLIETVRGEKTFPKVSGDVFASTQMRASTSRKTSPADSQIDDTEAKPGSGEQPVPVAIDEPAPSRDLLSGMSYVDAVIWLMTRLADGLAHAHHRGILHLDIKPHNVLVSDDGQPMLLDFNLALDVKTMTRDRVGGTWPYMSPEQICEYIRRPGGSVDARSDLYSLGVIFYELLTLQHPFPPVHANDAGLNAAIDARMTVPPCVRRFHPDVPPSIAAVIEKLLQPRPIDRYQTADELREDLHRHAEHRPLKYAKDRSLRERAVKWHRRNPKASLIACIAVLFCGLAFTASQMMSWAKDRERVAAVAKAGDFRNEFVGLRLDLASTLDAGKRNTALQTVEKWLADYRVGQPDWADQPALRLLPEAERDGMRNQLAEAAMLAAHAEWLNGRFADDPNEHYAKAAKWIETARSAFGDNSPEALARQSRDLAGMAYEPETPANNATELYTSAIRLVAAGQHAKAAEALLKLTELEPSHYAGQFALGVCYEITGQNQRATERFQIAKPLAPADPRPAYHRGLLLYHLGRYEEAESDLNEALRRNDREPGLYLQRGFIRRARGDLKGAIDDLAEELNLPNGRKYIALAMRAAIRDAQGDKAAAAKDRETLSALQPTTDLEFVARAAGFVVSNPEKALADYNSALKLNPDCLAALQNKSSLLADAFLQPELALPVIRRAVQAAPGLNRVRAGYSVLLARLDRRTEAHREAETALLLGSDPEVTYQVANTFALTGRRHPEDRDRALALLRQAFREGYRKYQTVLNDPDLESLREMPEFKKTLAAAMELNP